MNDWSMECIYYWLINVFNIWLTDQWIEYKIEWSMGWIHDWLILGLPIDWLINGLNISLNDQWVENMVDWLMDWIYDWLINVFNIWLTD